MPNKPADQSATSGTARPRAPRKPKNNGATADDSTSQSAGQMSSQIAGLPQSSEPSYDQIAEAAYHRFLRRGGGPGDDFNDWVEAERELKSRRS